MKITAVTRFKQGDIWQAMKRLGWSQSELARRAKMGPSTVGSILNMNVQSQNISDKRLRKLLDRIQTALAKAGEYLDVAEMWPKDFRGFDKSPQIETTMDVPLDRLLYIQHRKELQEAVEPYRVMDAEDLAAGLDVAISTLDDNEQTAIKRHFFDGQTNSHIAEEIGCTPQGASEIVRRSLRKLRHPVRMKPLEQFLVQV